MGGVGKLYSIIVLNLRVFNNMQWNIGVFIAIMLTVGFVVLIILGLYFYWLHVSRRVGDDVRNHVLAIWVHTEADLVVGNRRTFGCAVQWDGNAIDIRLLVCVLCLCEGQL